MVYLLGKNAMVKQYEVFVSSKMLELKPERDLLLRVDSSHYAKSELDLRPWVFEANDGAPASNKSIRDTYLKALERSVLYVGIFWNQYGEWTIDEFERATEWNIDRHIYIKNVESEKRDNRLTEFLEKQSVVQSGVTAKYFRTLDDLRIGVENSINTWIQERTVWNLGSNRGILSYNPDDLVERSRNFIGREQLFTQITGTLDSGVHVLLHGFSGSGKTALAAEVAAKCIQDTNEPVLWLRAGDQAADDLFHAIARTLNMYEQIAQELGSAKLQAVRRALTSHRVRLLVLDDAWNAEAIVSVLNALPQRTSLLVTSRNRIPLLHLINIGKLNRIEALKLLSFYGDSNWESDIYADNLCSRLEDNAFALRIAGMTLSVEQQTPMELLKRITESPHRLKIPLEFARDGQQSIADLIEASLSFLYMSGPQGRQAFRVFLEFGALFSPSFTPKLLKLYTSENFEGETNIEACLAELQNRGLTEYVKPLENTSDFYRIADLAYAFSKSQVTEAQYQKMLDACLVFTRLHSEPSTHNFAIINAELNNLLGAATYAMDVKRYKEVKEFAELLYSNSGFLELQGYYTEAEKLIGKTLEIAELEKNTEKKWTILNDLGNILYRLGELDRARDYYQHILNEADVAGSREVKSTGLGGLGNIYFRLGKYQEAEKHLSRAIAIRTKDIETETSSTNWHTLRELYGYLGNLATVRIYLGGEQQAVPIYEEAIAFAQLIGDKKQEATLLNKFGNLYVKLEQREKASKYFSDSLSLGQEIGDQSLIAYDLHGIGNICLDLGDYQKSLEYLERSFHIANQIRDKALRGIILVDLGYVFRGLGQYEVALKHFHDGLTSASEMDDKELESKLLGGLGTVYRDIQQYELAITYLQKSLELARQNSDLRRKVQHWVI